MNLVKCPRCELNYILDGDKLCTVCRREVRGEVTELDPDDIPDLCSECGENAAVAGGELCIVCLKDLARRVAVTTDDVIVVEDPVLEIDSVSTMDEIEIDIEELEGEEFEDEVFEEEEEEDEEDEEEEENTDDDLFDR